MPQQDWTADRLEAEVKKWAGEVVDKSNDERGKKVSDDVAKYLKERLPEYLKDLAQDKELAAQLFGGGKAANDDNLKDRHRVARAYRAAALARKSNGGVEEAVAIARKHFPDQADFIEKALGTTSDTAGAVTIDEEVLDDFRLAVRPMNIFRKMGARIVPLASGDGRLPISTAGATATWEAESTPPNASQQTTNKRDLKQNELVVLTAVATALLNQASVQVDEFIIADQRRAIGQAEDIAFIRGASGGNNPVGVRNLTAAGNITASAGATAAQAELDIYNLISTVGSANIDLATAGFMISFRTYVSLMRLRESAGGNRIFEELRSGSISSPTRDGLPKLAGFPVGVSTNVPITLGAGSSESEIYFGNFDDYVIAETSGLAVDVSDVAAYIDASGNMQAAFSNRETVVRSMLREDGVQRYDTSFAIKTGVLY